MISPINFALVAQKHPPMYLMHKYWARKPHNVVAEYISHYTNEGDVILDPFVGSGVTAIEAIRLGRKAIAIDLDPVATFITRMTAMAIDLKKFEEAFKFIEKGVKNKINEFYKTKCVKCGNTGIATHLVWEDKKDKEELTEIWYNCVCHKNTLKKKPDKEDFKNLEKIEKMEIPYWYPTTRLMYNGLDFKEGTHDPKINSVDKLFTKRELIALSILFNEIEKLKNKDIKELMKFVFTSGVAFSSKLIFNRTSIGGPGWNIHRYWVPPNRLIRNVWEFFEERYQKVYRGKENSNNRIKEYKEAKSFNELNDGKNILIKTHNALELTDIIPANSVDYIFTDPPYGGSIQYFELSTLWSSWLKMDLDYKDEITVNKNQNKDFDYYHKMLKAAFKQMYAVLKPEKYLTVTFHSTDIKVWNSIIKAVVSAGFILEKIIYQPPALASAKGQLQPYGSAVGDYYIRFKKPKGENNVTEKQVDYEYQVITTTKRIIEERGEPTIYQHILNGIMVDLEGGRYIPIGARNIEDVLKEHVGKEFELIDIRNEKGKKVGVKWWIKGRDFSNFSEPALRDRVERSVLQLLDKKIKVSFDEVLQSIFIQFSNALTPDTQDIREILKEYATRTKDGKWRLKPGLTENERISKHTEMIYYLAILGKKANYNILIGKNEQNQKYANKSLKELDDESEININRDSRMKNERVRQIDILWVNKITSLPEYEFEIENTTGITDAIIRGANLDLPMVKRFIVIPEDRENLLHKRLQEPLIEQSVQKENWHFIRYSDVKDLFNLYKRNEEFDIDKLNSIAKLPKVKIEKQKTLNDVK